MDNHGGTGTDVRRFNDNPLGPVVRSNLLRVCLHPTDLPSSTLLPSLGQSKLSPAPSKVLLFETGVLGGPTVV